MDKEQYLQLLRDVKKVRDELKNRLSAFLDQTEKCGDDGEKLKKLGINCDLALSYLSSLESEIGYIYAEKAIAEEEQK